MHSGYQTFGFYAGRASFVQQSPSEVKIPLAGAELTGGCCLLNGRVRPIADDQSAGIRFQVSVVI
jgi:hypothetical protein